MLLNNFTPIETNAISASTTSASFTFTAGANVNQLRVFNSTPNIAFIRWGTGSQTAVTTDMPVAPGVTEVFGKGLAPTVAVILAAGTGTVYVTAGEGQ